MSLLTRKRTILAKIEAVYGTDPVPTGAANAILVSDLTLTPLDSELASRDLVRPFLGNSEQLPVAVSAQAEFAVEIAGSGTAGTAPAWGPLLRACAFAETLFIAPDPTPRAEYLPVSAGIESVTIYVNVDGVLHKLLGARGTVRMEMNARSIPRFRFTFRGLFVAIADGAAPAVTLTAWQKPLPVNKGNTSGLSLHGFAGGVMSELSIDVANSVVFRSLVGQELVAITDRQSSGSISLEAVTVATKDWWTSAKDAATGAFSILHGLTAGNKIKVDAPAVQLLSPQYQDLDGIQMLQMQMGFQPTTAGNDELKITAL